MTSTEETKVCGHMGLERAEGMDSVLEPSKTCVEVKIKLGVGSLEKLIRSGGESLDPGISMVVVVVEPSPTRRVSNLPSRSLSSVFAATREAALRS